MRVLKKMAMVVAAAGSMLMATAAKADLVPFPGATFTTSGGNSITSGPETLAVTVNSAAYAPGTFNLGAAGYTGGNVLIGSTATAATDWFYVYQFANLAASNVNADHFSVGVGSTPFPGGAVVSIGYDTQDGDGVAPNGATKATLSGSSSDWFFTSTTIGHPGESVVLVLESPLSPNFSSAAVSQGVATSVFPVLVPAAQGTTPFPLPRASFGFIGLMVLFGGARLVRSRRNLAL